MAAVRSSSPAPVSAALQAGPKATGASRPNCARGHSRIDDVAAGLRDPVSFETLKILTGLAWPFMRGGDAVLLEDWPIRRRVPWHASRKPEVTR